MMVMRHVSLRFHKHYPSERRNRFRAAVYCFCLLFCMCIVPAGAISKHVCNQRRINIITSVVNNVYFNTFVLVKRQKINKIVCSKFGYTLQFCSRLNRTNDRPFSANKLLWSLQTFLFFCYFSYIEKRTAGFDYKNGLKAYRQKN